MKSGCLGAVPFSPEISILRERLFSGLSSPALCTGRPGKDTIAYTVVREKQAKCVSARSARATLGRIAEQFLFFPEGYMHPRPLKDDLSLRMSFKRGVQVSLSSAVAFAPSCGAA